MPRFPFDSKRSLKIVKRVLDIFFSGTVLFLASPVLVPIMLLVWLQDFHSPFYVAPRVGVGERPFRMVKMRSMVINADRTGIDSTKTDDTRITAVGRFIRRFKIDEITQLWNVLKGDMSLVGPRPNVRRDVDLYTQEEFQLLSVKPGITDFASIVFADEGEVLKGSKDPDLKYNQLIRPWKSRLGLLYVAHRSFWLDGKLILLTLLALVSREEALRLLSRELEHLGVEERLRVVAERRSPLYAYPPPGATEIVTAR